MNRSSRESVHIMVHFEEAFIFFVVVVDPAPGRFFRPSRLEAAVSLRDDRAADDQAADTEDGMLLIMASNTVVLASRIANRGEEVVETAMCCAPRADRRYLSV